MNDLIRRQDLYDKATTLEAQALDYVGRLIERDGEETSTEYRIWSAILKERSAFVYDVYNASPAQQWIPVEEGLPDSDAIMFVTYNDPRTHERMMWCGWYEMEDVWYIDGEEHSREYGNEVVAWMPLPEPYAPTQSNDSKALDALEGVNDGP